MFKKLINNHVLHCIFIMFFAFILMQGLFRLGSLVLFGSFDMTDDTKGIAAFVGIIMGVALSLYHFIESD